MGGVRPLAPAEAALAEATVRQQRQLAEQAQRKVAVLERALAEIELEEAAALADVAVAGQRQAEEQAAAEAAAAAARQQQRAALLTGLRSQHQQQAAEGQRRVQKLEAEAVRQAKAREAAAAAARAAAEQQAAAENAARSAQEQQQREVAAKSAADAQTADAAAQAAAQRKKEAAHAKAAQAAAQASGVRIGASAAAWEKQCGDALAAAQASVKPFVDDRAMRDKKRAIDKFVTLNVQQISATLEQIRLKAQALVGFVGQQHGFQRTYALLTLANKLVSQCEVQVTRLHSFAFPLAEVAVAVMAAHPDFVPLLAARLHQVCPLSVPKYFAFKSGQGQDAEDVYLRQLGYKISTDEDTGQISRESTDEFVGRQAGYLMLYAAAMQSGNPQNPHGLQHAWTLLARLLNALPANRVTATAVDAVLKVVGWRMNTAYRRQFTKLLQYIDTKFLPALGTANDPDARAVYTRIQTYLRTQQYRSPPEGRDMPQFDSSSYDRA
ncbi:Nucleoporin GLE1 [Micractinium conductrix]|uniref:mRNA export factor GLE1 n=1 Tax=Micractinium conductrix TaxID=554055 RepID=A0A2P6VCU0_9CHLO|nr:Nucleoporin GLE1 [Micractinium conductrix]|eukprot:PSC71897.1 Nucleoporin GLE1 [Micractinium conductrix]